MLRRLTDWKQFERLAADLLTAEGLTIDSEPSLDRTGTDFKASEEFRSHSGSAIRVRWRVQCKHYAQSGKNLNRSEAVEILNLFRNTSAPDEGLYIVTSTDYTEEAKRVFDDYSARQPGIRIMLWNRRQLISRLERHPELVRRYGLELHKVDYLSVLAPLQRYAPLGVLLISDQSVLAHDVAEALRLIGCRLVFLPFWNYLDAGRLALLDHTVLQDKFDLVVCFLGDSFSLPLPTSLVDRIVQLHIHGSSVLFFPFVAWSMRRGLYPGLRGVSPVELLDPTKAKEQVTSARLLGEHRKGDFRWLLSFDSFAEDQYMELAVDGAEEGFSIGLSAKFGISHSFEYLRPADGAKVQVTDTAGNPLVVTRETTNGRVCYLNTCCHSCLSPVPISSPLAASTDFSILFRNILVWLVGKNEVLKPKGG